MVEKDTSWWAGPLGLAIGLLFFIFLDQIGLPSIDDDDGDETDVDGGDDGPPSAIATERTPLRATSPLAIQVDEGKNFPTARVAAVIFDGIVDGLTLGVAISVGLIEAITIALAMTLEMCFVGIALTVAIAKTDKSHFFQVFVALAVPLSMYIGFVVGAYALKGVEKTSDTFVIVIGIGAGALLYLALADLTPEVQGIVESSRKAHPSDQLTQLTVTGCMFTGLLLILILENASPESIG